MSQEKTYARVINDGEIAERNVTAQNIRNRNHPIEMYTEVIFEGLPTAPKFHKSVEQARAVKNVLMNKWEVIVSYQYVPLTLQEMLNEVNSRYNSFPVNEDERTPIEEVDPAAVAQCIELSRLEGQRRLDSFAKERQYDGIISLASYATSKDVNFATEGQRGVDLRDQVWAALRAYSQEVATKVRPVPRTEQEVFRIFPALTWE